MFSGNPSSNRSLKNAASSSSVLVAVAFATSASSRFSAYCNSLALTNSAFTCWGLFVLKTSIVQPSLYFVFAQAMKCAAPSCGFIRMSCCVMSMPNSTGYSISRRSYSASAFAMINETGVAPIA